MTGGRPLKHPHRTGTGLKVRGVGEYLRTSLWFVPVLCVSAAVALAVVTLRFDRGRHDVGPLVFSGSAESARSVLSAILTSIATLTALVFSITIVVLQLASSQYSPRVLRTFLRDRRSQLVLGVLLATFAYAMLVLRAVRGGDRSAEVFVPRTSVHAAFLLTAVSLLFFVLYIHHMAQSMQASSIIAEVSAETAATLRRLYPSVGRDPVQKSRPAARDSDAVISSAESGYLEAVNEDFLFNAAREADVTVRLVPAVGDFVPSGSRLFVVSPGLDEDRAEALREGVALGRRRTMQQDATFGFRQLVDIAEKALSPGVNDPTTAVEALDRLHELLLLLAPRQFPAREREDDDGIVRLVLPRPDWEAYVHLALDEVRQYGEGSIQVTRRLRSLVNELLEVVPDARREVLLRQQHLLDESADRGFDDLEDVAIARNGSRHG